MPYSPEAKSRREEVCEAHKQQVEEAMDTLSEGPEGFYKSYLD